MTTENFEFPELVIHTHEGMRFYEAPDGNKYPSITTVLGKQPGKQKGLREWRERIGEEQARIVSGKAARRGTAFHNICEDYLNGVEDITHHKDKNFLAYCMFGEMKSHLDEKINKVVLQEQTMYSPKYKVAGRCDFIGVYNNTLAVVDFKTTTTPKKEEWIEDYYLQLGAYSLAHNVVYNSRITQGIVLLCTVDNLFQDFRIQGAKLEEFQNKFLEKVEQFYNQTNMN